MTQPDLFGTKHRSILEQAQEGKPGRCPTCGRLVKLYKRHVHREMVDFLARLLALDNLTPGLFHTTRQVRPGATAKSATDASYLTAWGLVMKQGKSYRITAHGRRWLAGETRIPAACHMLCGQVVGWDDNLITPEQARDRRPPEDGDTT